MTEYHNLQSNVNKYSYLYQINLKVTKQLFVLQLLKIAVLSTKKRLGDYDIPGHLPNECELES